MPEGIMPMSIHKLGNSSVATIPTLYDLILNNQIENHEIKDGMIEKKPLDEIENVQNMFQLTKM